MVKESLEQLVIKVRERLILEFERIVKENRDPEWVRRMGFDEKIEALKNRKGVQLPPVFYSDYLDFVLDKCGVRHGESVDEDKIYDAITKRIEQGDDNVPTMRVTEIFKQDVHEAWGNPHTVSEKALDELHRHLCEVPLGSALKLGVISGLLKDRTADEFIKNFALFLNSFPKRFR